MVLGLGAFECVTEIGALPDAISRSLLASHGSRIDDVLRTGRRIAEARTKVDDVDELAMMLVRS
jgi:hypothetical protein